MCRYDLKNINEENVNAIMKEHQRHYEENEKKEREESDKQSELSSVDNIDTHPSTVPIKKSLSCPDKELFIQEFYDRFMEIQQDYLDTQYYYYYYYQYCIRMSAINPLFANKLKEDSVKDASIDHQFASHERGTDMAQSSFYDSYSQFIDHYNEQVSDLNDYFYYGMVQSISDSTIQSDIVIEEDPKEHVPFFEDPSETADSETESYSSDIDNSPIDVPKNTFDIDTESDTPYDKIRIDPTTCNTDTHKSLQTRSSPTLYNKSTNLPPLPRSLSLSQRSPLSRSLSSNSQSTLHKFYEADTSYSSAMYILSIPLFRMTRSSQDLSHRQTSSSCSSLPPPQPLSNGMFSF